MKRIDDVESVDLCIVAFYRFFCDGIHDLDLLIIFIGSVNRFVGEEIFPFTGRVNRDRRRLLSVGKQVDSDALRTSVLRVFAVFPYLLTGYRSRLGRRIVPCVGEIHTASRAGIVLYIRIVLRIFFRNGIGCIVVIVIIKVKAPFPCVFTGEIILVQCDRRAFDLIRAVLDMDLDPIGALFLRITYPSLAAA